MVLVLSLDNRRICWCHQRFRQCSLRYIYISWDLQCCSYRKLQPEVGGMHNFKNDNPKIAKNQHSLFWQKTKIHFLKSNLLIQFQCTSYGENSIYFLLSSEEISIYTHLSFDDKIEVGTCVIRSCQVNKIQKVKSSRPTCALVTEENDSLGTLICLSCVLSCNVLSALT